MMWLCPKCNKENEDRMTFCAQCGFDESRNYEKYRLITLLPKVHCLEQKKIESEISKKELKKI